MQRQLENNREINEPIHSDSERLGAFAFLPLELMIPLFSNLSIKDEINCHLINHTFYVFMDYISEQRVKKLFPRDYEQIQQTQTEVNWNAELSRLGTRELSHVSEATRNILYQLVEEGFHHQFNFIELVSRHAGAMAISPIDWLIRNGHQSLIDDIFTRLILGKFYLSGAMRLAELEEDLAITQATSSLSYDDMIWSMSLFDWAAKCNQVDFMQQILNDEQRSKKIQTQLQADGKAKTPIHYAMQHKHIEMLELLLSFIQKKLPLEARRLSLWDSQGCLSHGVLNEAAVKGDSEVFTVLLAFYLKHYSQLVLRLPTEFEASPFKFLHVAAAKGNLDFLKKTIEMLQQDGNDQVMNFLLNSFQLGRTPYAWAAQFEQTECLTYLFQCDPISGSRALSSVIQKKYEISHSIYLSHHLDLFCPSEYAQTREVSCDYLAICKTLLQHGANINILDDGGKTALHRAVLGEKVEAVHFLIKEGANINAIDSQGKTALDYLTKMTPNSQRNEMMGLFHDAGAIEDAIEKSPDALRSTPDSRHRIGLFEEKKIKIDARQQPENLPAHKKSSCSIS